MENLIFIDDDQVVNCYHKIVVDSFNEVDGHLDCEFFDKTETALDYLDSHDGDQPNYVFLDLNMSTANGWEFLETYFSRKNTDSRVIILSTIENTDDRLKALASPAVYDYCVKPLTVKYLETILQY